MLRRSFALALLAFVCGCAQVKTPHTHAHRFSGAERRARVFDDPARDRWQKPDEVIAALALAPEAAVGESARAPATLPLGWCARCPEAAFTRSTSSPT